MLGKLYNFPNENLVNSLSKFIEQNNDNSYDLFLNELEKSNLLFLIKSEKNDPVGFVIIKSDSKNYLPLFTDFHEYIKLNLSEEINYNFSSINDITKIILQKENKFIDGIVIDPLGCNFIVERNYLEKR